MLVRALFTLLRELLMLSVESGAFQGFDGWYYCLLATSSFILLSRFFIYGTGLMRGFERGFWLEEFLFWETIFS